MTVRELESRLSASEMFEWYQFLQPPEAKPKVKGNFLDLEPDDMAAAMTRG